MNVSKKVVPILGLVALAGFTAALFASTNSPIQVPFQILGIPIVGDVQLAASDSASQAFQSVAPGCVSMVKQYLPETVAFTGAGLNQLDPERLYFLFDYAPRAYYLYEGACYTNALGCTIANASNPTNSILPGTSYILFPDFHSSISWVCASGSGVRSLTEPLMMGDFVQLPTVKAGQQLSFFIEANLTVGAGDVCTPQATYYNGTSTNPDNFQHMVAFYPSNSQYIIIGFEDMYGGGDKDCNDVMIAVDVGPLNAQVWQNPSTLPK